NFCIKVLEGTEQSLSKRIALRTIVHLVGDIHQPLHCASGYYNVSNTTHPIIEMDPVTAKPFKAFEDRGGNLLRYGTGRMDELHGMWAGDLVSLNAGGSLSYKELAGQLEDAASTTTVNDPPDHHKWAAHWAAESVQLAKTAILGVAIGSCTLNTGKT